jgi:hypothetical protein
MEISASQLQAMQNGKIASASTHLNAGWEEDPPAILSDQINHG